MGIAQRTQRAQRCLVDCRAPMHGCHTSDVRTDAACCVSPSTSYFMLHTSDFAHGLGIRSWRHRGGSATGGGARGGYSRRPATPNRRPAPPLQPSVHHMSAYTHAPVRAINPGAHPLIVGLYDPSGRRENRPQSSRSDQGSGHHANAIPVLLPNNNSTLIIVP